MIGPLINGNVKRVIDHVQQRDVFLNNHGTCLSVIEHAQELDVFCHSGKSPVEEVKKGVGNRRIGLYKTCNYRNSHHSIVVGTCSIVK